MRDEGRGGSGVGTDAPQQQGVFSSASGLVGDVQVWLQAAANTPKTALFCSGCSPVPSVTRVLTLLCVPPPLPPSLCHQPHRCCVRRATATVRSAMSPSLRQWTASTPTCTHAASHSWWTTAGAAGEGGGTGVGAPGAIASGGMCVCAYSLSTVAASQALTRIGVRCKLTET